MRYHDWNAVDAGHGDLQHPRRPQDATHLRYSLAPKDGSRGIGGD
jgi:hypothetical protein